MAHNRLPDSWSADSEPPQTRACRPSSCSSASLGCVADLVFRYLPVRTLLRCKVLSKEWRAWCDDNLLHIAKQRRKDESSKSDWYFPLAFEHRKHVRQRGESAGSSWTWKWYGMHQGTKMQHVLPGFDFLPGFSLSRYAVQAVSSGLVVLTTDPHKNDCDLIVCNPLSKKWKRLPRHADCVYRSRYGARITCTRTHLVLEDLPNEYMVIILSFCCINVYTSSNEQWVCAAFGHHLHCHSSVCLKGHVYMLQMMEEVPYLGTLRWSYKLSIFDIESRRYEFRTFISSIPVTQDYCEENVFESYQARYPILVVCMDNLFAVGVSCRAGRNHAKPRRRHETYVANCEFHIFSLMKEGRLLDEGLWKHVVTVPVVFCGVKQDVVQFWEACRMFSSVARSNMIYMAWSSRRLCGKCLHVNYLEYDVVSGLHTTYAVGACHGQEVFNPFLDCGSNMAYSSCLDLKP